VAGLGFLKIGRPRRRKQMGLAILAILVIAIGAVLRIMAPGMGPKGGSVRLLSYIVMLFGVALGFLNAIILVDVGEVGVKHFLGRVSPSPLEQGVHVINPLASVEKMSVREQAFPVDGSVERIEAQTSEQLNVTLEVSMLYRIDGANAPDLYQRIGSERQITSRIVLNAVRNGVRDAVATKSINEIFSPDRREVANDMTTEIQAKAGDRIHVLDVFVRDIQAPPRVREAIEEKLQREQQVAAERFQTEIIQERARQQAEEAKGIAEAQQIITEGLTPEYLTFFYIQQLSEMPEGSVVYVPTEGGIPLIRPLGGGR
jgi:regulator of protease activity HflC (stomatin/prohibitin superfamily)